MRPLIGITTYYVKDRELDEKRYRGFQGQDMLMSTMDYSRCIERAGGIPVTIPVIEGNQNYIDSLVNKLDGFLFTGGPDIHPKQYGQYIKKGLGSVVPERDDFELKLLKQVLDNDKPVFGICRGFQIINTHFGGSLYQDINDVDISDLEHVGISAPKYSYCHKVNILKQSKLHKAFNKETIDVNSFHHQAVEQLGKGLIKTAWANDGIIEAFEHEDYSFVIGVQWHPEMMAEIYNEQMSVFQLFIDEIINNN